MLILDTFQKMLTEISSTPSSNDKKEILSNYPELKKYIEYTYNPYKKFKVTSDTIKKLVDVSISPLSPAKCGDECKEAIIFDTLDGLVAGRISGHAAVATVKGLVAMVGVQYESLIFKIIDKDLEIRLGVSEINKVFQGLIPEFSVALAEKFDADKDEINENWFISRKLDGLRNICIYNDGEINFFSREGNEFFTLENLKPSIRNIAKENKLKRFVLDGECCVMKNGLEDFTGVMKEIKKKNHQIENPRYYLFDILNYDDFMNKKSKETFKQRYDTLQNMLGQDTVVTALVQRPYSEEILTKLQDQGRKDGWEGLMLRNGAAPYKGKRSRDLLKVKDFMDAEYVVEDIEVGSFRVNTPDGEKTITTMTKVIISHKGCQVRVGSGFSLEERAVFYKTPSEIVGKTITVKYFAESKNQKGGFSLRFPTCKIIHGFKREA